MCFNRLLCERVARIHPSVQRRAVRTATWDGEMHRMSPSNTKGRSSWLRPPMPHLRWGSLEMRRATRHPPSPVTI